MNIKIEKIDSVTARIFIIVNKKDIQPAVEQSFSRLCKNAVVSGFRKGNVPRSLLYSMYGENILLEELNKWTSDKLLKYIKENNLILVGEPLLSTSPSDLKHLDEYEFIFDIGLQPEITIDLTKKYKFSYYTIVVTEEMIEKQIYFLRNQFGCHNVSVNYIKREDRVKGVLTELDQNGIKKKGGLNFKEAILILLYMRNDEEKAKFIDKTVGETVLFNPYKAFGGNEKEISHFLGIKEVQAKNYTGDFLLTISEIDRYQLAKIDNDFFDKIYGKGIISSEVVFREKIKENLILQWNVESDYRFLLDVKKFFLRKIRKVQFPEDFLKRWWRKNHSEVDLDLLEKDFLSILKEIKIQCIWSKIVEENELIVNLKDLRQVANVFIRSHFSLYHLIQPVDNVVENYVNKLLKIKSWIQKLREKALEIKIIQCLKEQMIINLEMITEEEFRKLPE